MTDSTARIGLRRVAEADWQALAGRRIDLVSVLSTEERGRAWGDAVAARGMLCGRHVAFDYGALVEATEPELKAELDHLRSQAEVIEVPAFALAPLEQKLAEVLASAEDLLLVDVSCMSRVHLVALANVLAADAANRDAVWVCYANPLGYGVGRHRSFGWRDTVLARVGARSDAGRVSRNGIILFGHTSEVLSLAFGEDEPESGIMVFTTTPGRPDFLAKAMEANAYHRERLEQQILAAPEGWGHPAWKTLVADISDLNELVAEIDALAARTPLDEWLPIYPIGPKPVTLAVLLQLATAGVPAQAVCPVPRRFSLRFSTGLSDLWMLEASRLVAAH